MTNHIIPFNPEELDKKYNSPDPQRIFEEASIEPINPGHMAYLKAKSLDHSDIPGARFGERYGLPALLIPIKNIEGKVQSIQYIFEDREGKTQKRFLEGANKSDGFIALDDLGGCEKIFITEGVSTAASLRKILKSSDKWKGKVGVVCAFSALDIPKIASQLVKNFNYAEMIPAPDHDSAGNKASRDCKEIGEPVFPPKIEGITGGTDWNDILVAHGVSKSLEILKESLEIREQAIEANSLYNHAETVWQSMDEDEKKHTPILKPYPLTVFPESIGNLAQEIVQKIQVTPEIVGGCLLSALSLAIQGFGNLRVGTQDIAPTIFTIIVAESGERKTSVERVILRKFREIEKKEFKEYNQAKDIHKILEKAWEKSIKEKDQITAEELKERLKDKPTPPINPKILMTDPTIEGIFKLFSIGRGSLGLFSDEGGKMLGGWSMSKDNQLAGVGHLSNLWDGSPIERTRSSDESNVTLFDKRMSVCLMIQPNIFHGKVWNNQLMQEQGLLARFLIAEPKILAGTRTYTIEDYGTEIENAKVFEKTIETAHSLSLEEFRFENIYLSKEAIKEKVNMQKELEGELSIGGKYHPVKAYANKATEQALRISAVFSIFEDIEHIKDKKPVLWMISGEHFKRGKLLAFWYLDETLRLMNLDIDSPKSEIEKVFKALENLCQKNKEGITVRELTHRLPKNMNRKSDHIRGLLERLKSVGKIDSLKEGSKEIWWPL